MSEIPDLGLPTPDPAISDDALPYWEASADGRLVLPHCTDCDALIWFPRGFCPECGSFDIEWLEAPGTGSVYSFSIARRGQGLYRDVAPYVLAYVELDPPAGMDGPGPRVVTNIVGCDPESVTVDQRVEAEFHPTPSGHGLLRFHPA